MIEYLDWFTEDEKNTYKVRVKFSTLKDPNAIAERRTNMENMFHLISRLEQECWKMKFDEYPGDVRKIEFIPENNTVLISVDLTVHSES